MSQLTPDLLLRAYAVGIFPMAESRYDERLFWIDPESRGVLPLDRVRVPRRLRRRLRQQPFEVTADAAFDEVMASCAEATRERPNTWINGEIVNLYSALHRMGHAHSIECWRGAKLVGGLYGVSLGGAFFGESMFSRETDASKIALIHLVARLRAGGYRLLDTQFVTAHLKQFGTVEITRAEYHRRLAHATKAEARFQCVLEAEELESFLQSTTQMS
ncbi:MAG: leucyl/phenylalanyl-tRNA--protein transferase [Alphaproteobacteria bacterium]